MDNNLEKKDKRYPKGHFAGMWMGIGIAIFSGIGIPLSIITHNFGFIGIGPAIGVAIGLAIGQSLENKYQKEGKIRPLTEAEKKKQKIAAIVGIALLAIGVLTLVLGIFLFKKGSWNNIGHLEYITTNENGSNKLR